MAKKNNKWLKKVFYDYHNLDLIDDHVTCIFGHQNPQYHHIKKESQGGKTTGENLTPLCYDCHINKHHNMNTLKTEDIILQHNLQWPKF